MSECLMQPFSATFLLNKSIHTSYLFLCKGFGLNQIYLFDCVLSKPSPLLFYPVIFVCLRQNEGYCHHNVSLSSSSSVCGHSLVKTHTRLWFTPRGDHELKFQVILNIPGHFDNLRG